MCKSKYFIPTKTSRKERSPRINGSSLNWTNLAYEKLTVLQLSFSFQPR